MLPQTDEYKVVLSYPTSYRKEFNITYTHQAELSEYEMAPDDDSVAAGKYSFYQFP